MLRAKQLGTLSQCARSFILSGSRSGSADGSCTCTDDETCVSRTQSRGTFLDQTKSILVSEVAAKVGSPSFKGAIRAVSHHHPESCSQSSLPQVLSPKSSLRLVNPSPQNVEGSPQNNDAQGPPEKMIHSCKIDAEHLVKAGILTTGLPEIVNHKIQVTDYGGLLTTEKCTVVSTQCSSNIKSPNGKQHKRAIHFDAQPNHPFTIEGEGTSTSYSPANHAGPKFKNEKSGVTKAKQNVPAMPSEISVEDNRSSSISWDKRRATPQREKSHSHVVTDMTSNGGCTEGRPALGENIKAVNKVRAARPVKVEAGGTLLARQYYNVKGAVELFSHTLRHLKWGPAAEEALESLPYRLDAYQANQVLKLLQDYSVALGFFNWLKGQPGFKHDDHTYTTMVGILGRARQFGLIKRLWEEMIRSGCQPNVVTYNRLIHGYGCANYIGEAVNVFYQMQEVGCQPDRVTYCTLIDIHAKAGFLEVAMDLYRRMQEAGLSPDTFTYSVMINCLGKSGHLSSAYKLFCEMVDQGCVPNLVTYNIMIALQAKARNYPCALKLYRNMQAAGFHPDKITYSIVMEVLGHYGHLDEAEAVFAEMEQDWVPDEPVYGLLIDMWGKAGNVEKARAWFQSMLNAGLRPNVPTCNSLLSGFLRAQRFSDAHDVLQSMLGLGLVPSLQTYTLLLSCCTETRSYMGLCCELMAITGHPAHTFLISLPAAEPGGQNVRDHASAFLDLVHSEDRESKRGLVDAVIDFLHKSGLKEEAGSVWEVAAQRNVYPGAVREKSSSYWLINLHVMSDGTAVTALSRTFAWFRRQMLASGIGPSRIDIITGWGRRSKVTGSSLVRQSVGELLHLFGFPFFTGKGNSGCFVACGEPLHSWLVHPSVERMHLL